MLICDNKDNEPPPPECQIFSSLQSFFKEIKYEFKLICFRPGGGFVHQSLCPAVRQAVPFFYSIMPTGLYYGNNQEKKKCDWIRLKSSLKSQTPRK
jgi:hypothetical protein